MSHKSTSVLFICMGNICRSPAAEAVFLAYADKLGVADRFEVDGAGTGSWHVGDRADSRSMLEGERRGYSLTTRARQVSAADWNRFDWLICMDENNRQELVSLGAPDEKIRLLSDWHPDASVTRIPDPYYGGNQGFVQMYDLIELSMERLIKELLEKSNR